MENKVRIIGPGSPSPVIKKGDVSPKTPTIPQKAPKLAPKPSVKKGGKVK